MIGSNSIGYRPIAGNDIGGGPYTYNESLTLSCGATLSTGYNYLPPGALAFDDFERSSLGSNWDIINGGLSIYNSSEFYPTQSSTESGAKYNAVTFNVNHWAEVVVTNTGTDNSTFVGPAARCSSGGNYYAYYICQSGELYCGRIVSGVWTDLYVNQTYGAPSNGDKLRIEASGTGSTVTLVLKYNGSTVTTINDTSGSRLTTGVPGISGYHSSSSYLRGEEWSAGDLSSGNTYNESATLAGSAALANTALMTLVTSLNLSASGSVSPGNLADLLRSISLGGNAAIAVLGGIIVNDSMTLSGAGAINAEGIKTLENSVTFTANSSFECASSQIANVIVNLSAIAAQAQVAPISFESSLSLTSSANIALVAGLVREALLTLAAQGQLALGSNATYLAAANLAAQAGYSPDGIGIFNYALALAAQAGYNTESSLFAEIFLDLLKDLSVNSTAKMVVFAGPKDEVEALIVDEKSYIFSEIKQEVVTNLPKGLLTDYE